MPEPLTRIAEGLDIATALAELAACEDHWLEMMPGARQIPMIAENGNRRMQSELGQCWALIDQVPDYLFVKDRDCRFIVANKAVAADLGVSSAKELKGATVCVQEGTTTEKNLGDFDKQNNLGTQPVKFKEASRRDRPMMKAGATPIRPTRRASPPSATRWRPTPPTT